MAKYTQSTIKSIADKLMSELSKRGLSGDCCIYINGDRYCGDFEGNWAKDDSEETFHSQDYCEYAGSKQIIGLSTEGPLYDIFYNRGTPEWLDNLLSENNLYLESCYSWFHVIVPDTDWEEWEYYKNPVEIKKQHFIYNDYTCPDFLIGSIRSLWSNLVEKEADEGACVIGAGIEFEYDNERYFMAPPTVHQGSLSWEKHTDLIMNCLKEAGATNVYYNPGRLD